MKTNIKYYYATSKVNDKTNEIVYQDYSGKFKTKEDSVKWYEKHGKPLEKNNKRELIHLLSYYINTKRYIELV